jgi:pilus assembly protein TadC
MRFGFEISSIAGGIVLIVLGNFIVIDILPFAVPVFNMMGGLLLVLPPVMSLYIRYRSKREIEEQFISFIMDLTDSIDSGMTLPMALEHCSKRDYLGLSPHVNHLVAQVNWGIPFRKALDSFARKTRSKPVRRAVSTIIETYRVGGKISDTLNSVAKSMTTINKINAERRASVYSQVVTSYMIFFIFIFIMVVIQIFILPGLSPDTVEDISLSGVNAYVANEVIFYQGITDSIEYQGRDFEVKLAEVIGPGEVRIEVAGTGTLLELGKTQVVAGLPLYLSSVSIDPDTNVKKAGFLFGDEVPLDYAYIFTVFIIIQGFFAGLATGKMAEGSLVAGFKHSMLLVFMGYIIFTLASQLPQIKLL